MNFFKNVINIISFIDTFKKVIKTQKTLSKHNVVCITMDFFGYPNALFLRLTNIIVEMKKKGGNGFFWISKCSFFAFDKYYCWNEKKRGGFNLLKHYELTLQLWKTRTKTINSQLVMDFSIQLCMWSQPNYGLVVYNHCMELFKSTRHVISKVYDI